MGSFSAKYILFELKKYRGVLFHENEGGCKIWRGIDLLFQNWCKEFDKFWPECSKVSKIFSLMGSLWAKYKLFELKKYRGVIFPETEEGYKIWRRIDSLFKNWQKEFDKFWPEHLKSLKYFHFNGPFFSKVYIIWAKIVQRSYLSWKWGGLQNLARNRLVVSKWCKEFDKFWPERSKVSKIFSLMGSLGAKYILFELKKYRGVIFHEIEEGYKNWRRIDSFKNWHKNFDKFWSEHSKVSKIFTLIGFFWAKYILFGLKKYRWIIFHETEEGYKTWRRVDLSFQNCRKKFHKFWPEHSKVPKISTSMGSFSAKYVLLELKKYWGVIFHDIEEWCKIWKKTG